MPPPRETAHARPPPPACAPPPGPRPARGGGGRGGRAAARPGRRGARRRDGFAQFYLAGGGKAWQNLEKGELAAGTGGRRPIGRDGGGGRAGRRPGPRG